MSRRPQSKARTLSWAVRQVFQPVLTPIPGRAPGDTSSETQHGSLLSTQVDEVVEDDEQQDAGTVNAGLSDKQLGKRKQRADEFDGVETRYTEDNLPAQLEKYWWQRYRLFSRYDEGIRMDYDGWFSVTPENIAAQIAERCRCGTVVDAFCGVGGNAIQFAMTCEKVIAIDNSPVRLACARENARIYGVEEHIEFVLADFVEWAKSRVGTPEAAGIEVVFMSPPWGGIDYRDTDEQQQQQTPRSGSERAGNDSSLIESSEAVVDEQSSNTQSTTDNQQQKKNKKQRTSGAAVVVGCAAAASETGDSMYACYGLDKLQPLHGKELFQIARSLTKNVAYYLPRNLDIHEAASLVASEDERVEVEEEWMGSKLKALCLYYGDLVNT